MFSGDWVLVEDGDELVDAVSSWFQDDEDEDEEDEDVDSWSHDDDDVSEDETKPRGLIRPYFEIEYLIYNLIAD